MNLYEDMEVAAAEVDERWHPGDSATPESPACPQTVLREAIRSLSRNFSIELLPRTARKLGPLGETVPQGTRVFIPFLPGAQFADCVPLAARLRREGVEPVPHIAARRLASRDELTRTLDRLRQEADVTQCLVIAGDAGTAAGPFNDSLSVLETGLLEEAGMERIFVGGQPEGLPGVPAKHVEEALIRKLDYAEHSPASLHLITQFTLDIGAVERWCERLQALGNELPVHIGIAGPTSLSTLLKFAALTGASASLRAMRRYGAKLTQLASEASPDALVTHLAARLNEVSHRTPIAGLHVYTFGGFDRAAKWMTALRDGAFTLRPDGNGFVVG